MNVRTDPHPRLISFLISTLILGIGECRANSMRCFNSSACGPVNLIKMSVSTLEHSFEQENVDTHFFEPNAGFEICSDHSYQQSDSKPQIEIQLHLMSASDAEDVEKFWVL